MRRSVDGEYDHGGQISVALGTISVSVRLVRGSDAGTIAMRIEYLAAIVIVAAGAGLAVHSVSLPPGKQSTPATAQLATVLAESVDPFLHRSGG